MEWHFHEDAPIYLQIMDQFKTQIATGNLKQGDKILSVRELAVEAGVNPNTMQKALSELEREGYLVSNRTAGRFVSQTGADQENLHQELLIRHIEAFLNNMGSLGFTAEETAKVIQEYVNKGGTRS